MVAFIDSNSVPLIHFRARPRVQGSTFATIQGPLLQSTSLESFDSHSQVLQGKSKPSARRLHRADHSNQQYSILALTESSGAVVERVAYQAYGQPMFASAAGTTLSVCAKATRYSCTGREWDASLELHHFRARWMSAVSGRFCGRDPAHYEDQNNLYVYVQGKALHAFDPTGSITIRQIGSVKASCANGASHTYEYDLHTADGKPPCPHPDPTKRGKGFLVQHVYVCCPKKKCKSGCCPGIEPSTELECGEYWEAWPWLGNSKPTSQRLEQNPFTDKALFRPPGESCGYYYQRATARFFCEGKTNSGAYIGALIDNWTGERPKGKGCGATKAGSLKMTNREPCFRREQLTKDREAQRIFQVDWNCCPRGNTYLNATANP